MEGRVEVLHNGQWGMKIYELMAKNVYRVKI